jgi:hypothetical protein
MVNGRCIPGTAHVTRTCLAVTSFAGYGSYDRTSSSELTLYSDAVQALEWQ